jgi:hypothetical protein
MDAPIAPMFALRSDGFPTIVRECTALQEKPQPTTAEVFAWNWISKVSPVPILLLLGPAFPTI